MTTDHMTIRDAPPGLLLLTGGNVVFKTEYMDQDSTGTHRPIVYVAASGERYHGEGYDVDCVEVTDEAIAHVREPLVQEARKRVREGESGDAMKCGRCGLPEEHDFESDCVQAQHERIRDLEAAICSVQSDRGARHLSTKTIDVIDRALNGRR